MAFVFAAVALLISAVSVNAAERTWIASTATAYQTGDGRPRTCDCHGHAARDDGFTGAFDVRQTMKNLGY